MAVDLEQLNQTVLKLSTMVFELRSELRKARERMEYLEQSQGEIVRWDEAAKRLGAKSPNAAYQRVRAWNKQAPHLGQPRVRMRQGGCDRFDFQRFLDSGYS